MTMETVVPRCCGVCEFDLHLSDEKGTEEPCCALDIEVKTQVEELPSACPLVLIDPVVMGKDM